MEGWVDGWLEGQVDRDLLFTYYLFIHKNFEQNSSEHDYEFHREHPVVLKQTVIRIHNHRLTKLYIL
jgi:hypothetical protein